MTNYYKNRPSAQFLRAQAATLFVAFSVSFAVDSVAQIQPPVQPAVQPAVQQEGQSAGSAQTTKLSAKLAAKSSAKSAEKPAANPSPNPSVNLASNSADVEASLPYTVRPRDKLISVTANLLNNPKDWSEVSRFNGLKNPNQISPGQVINIPTRLMKSQPVAAKIISTFGSVQLAGQPVAQGAVIGEGAKLQTAVNSSAVLELADGSRVTLMPGTLAEIVTSRNYASRDAAQSASSNAFSGLIRLVQGALDTLASETARRASPLQIQTPTSLVGVRGTQFRVAYEGADNQNARTEVLQGLVRADSPTQRLGADVPQGKGAVLNPTIKTINVVDLLQAPDLSALPGDIVKPQALWPMPVLAGAKAFRVQIAVDDSFSKIVRDVVVAGSGSGQTATAATASFADFSSLPNGAWFARVRGIDAAGLEGYDTAKAVQVVLAPPPYVAPRQWTISGDRLDVYAGLHVLQFSQVGLDASHLITAEVTSSAPPYASLGKATASGDKSDIVMTLGNFAPGVQLLLNLTVVQSDGAKVVPLAYRFSSLGGWGWAEGTLQLATPGKP